MKITSWDPNKSIIVLPRIDEVIQNHPQFSSVLKPSTLKQATDVFVDAITAFKSGELSSDELSIFGGHLFAFATKYPKSDFFQATLAAAELAFYLRHQPSNITTFLDIINTFYIQHKGDATTDPA